MTCVPTFVFQLHQSCTEEFRSLTSLSNQMCSQRQPFRGGSDATEVGEMRSDSGNVGIKWGECIRMSVSKQNEAMKDEGILSREMWLSTPPAVILF